MQRGTINSKREREGRALVFSNKTDIHIGKCHSGSLRWVNFQNEHRDLHLTKLISESQTGNMISKNPMKTSEILAGTLKMHKGR